MKSSNIQHSSNIGVFFFVKFVTLITMNHLLLGKRILIITAHPDDEAFLCAGTALHNHRAGGKSVLICATLGEKGSSQISRPVTEKQLKAIRRRELMLGAKSAKIHRVHVLGLPDGHVADRQATFVRASMWLAEEFKPEAILTFGPDGLTGHHDHIACWKVGQRIAKKLKVPVYVFTVAPRIKTLVPKWFKARRVNPHYQLKVAPFRKATLRIPTPRGFKRKVLSHYKSQLVGRDPYRGIPTYAAELFTAAEYFAQQK